ncbi:Receptor-like protein 9a [Camellia lanceoleosa]|uniref:Receptor-like protein 9a n=1 Tax=Camellia lanceoleosa TaxID=1840588 RepID=A0ACC0FDM4_9ERIC|nr:Receptor-like protein 9a [Camellia lanceoleosa]
MSIIVRSIIPSFEKLSVLRKLETLNLEHNKFNNSLLPSLGALTSLKTLNLGGNRFEGLFPAHELAYLGNVETLDLSSNLISGIQVVQVDCKCAIHDCHSSNKLEQLEGEYGNSDEEDDAEVAGEEEVASVQRNEMSLSGANASEGGKAGTFPSSVVESESKCGGNKKEAGVHKSRAKADGLLVSQRAKGGAEEDEVENVITPGYMHSLSGDAVNRPGINIEVVLDEAQSNFGLSDPSGFEVKDNNTRGFGQDDGVGAQPNLNPARVLGGPCNKEVQLPVNNSDLVKKNTSLRGRMGRVGGTSGTGERRANRSQTLFVSGFQRGAVFRATAAVLAQSISNESQVSRRRKKSVEEARATVQLGRRLGMSCEGKEAEVIQRLVLLEQQDEE